MCAEALKGLAGERPWTARERTYGFRLRWVEIVRTRATRHKPATVRGARVRCATCGAVCGGMEGVPTSRVVRIGAIPTDDWKALLLAESRENLEARS